MTSRTHKKEIKFTILIESSLSRVVYRFVNRIIETGPLCEGLCHRPVWTCDRDIQSHNDHTSPLLCCLQLSSNWHVVFIYLFSSNHCQSEKIRWYRWSFHRIMSLERVMTCEELFLLFSPWQSRMKRLKIFIARQTDQSLRARTIKRCFQSIIRHSNEDFQRYSSGTGNDSTRVVLDLDFNSERSSWQSIHRNITMKTLASLSLAVVRRRHLSINTLSLLAVDVAWGRPVETYGCHCLES